MTTRPVILSFVLLVSGALLLAHCGDSNRGAGTTCFFGSADGGTCSESDAAICPADPPNAGSACALSPSTPCSYPESCDCCTTPVATCQSGTWVITGGDALPTEEPECPDTVPQVGDFCGGACDFSSYSDTTCRYDCATGNLTERFDAAVTTFDCEQGSWQSTDADGGTSCELPDAGADASSDASMDADGG